MLVGIRARPWQFLLLGERILNVGESFRVANLTACGVGSPGIGLFLTFLLACLSDKLFDGWWLIVLLLLFELVLR